MMYKDVNHFGLQPLEVIQLILAATFAITHGAVDTD
jgi:hypothetical protein